MAVNVDESFIRLQPGILPENALLSFVSAEGSDGCADEVLGDQVEDMEWLLLNAAAQKGGHDFQEAEAVK
ncbi:hypothetical protein PInf_019395 [Phytophthora infestans]|nr:hypothetical protein PInf_019395 [Phytophthora infestans]